MLQLKTECLVKSRKLYFLAQENSVEFLVQVCLLYIPLVYSLYILISSLP